MSEVKVAHRPRMENGAGQTKEDRALRVDFPRRWGWQPFTRSWEVHRGDGPALRGLRPGGRMPRAEVAEPWPRVAGPRGGVRPCRVVAESRGGRKHGKLVVRADLPGMTKDDVKVEVADDHLTLQGDARKRRRRSAKAIATASPLRSFDRASRSRRRRRFEGLCRVPQGSTRDHRADALQAGPQVKSPLEIKEGK